VSVPTTIDLNANLGEGFGVWRLGDDDAMLGIGAQVSYRDLAGFSRRFIDVAPEDLHTGVVYQIGALGGLAQATDFTVCAVKPHGALYNTIVTNCGQTAVAEAVRDRLKATGVDVKAFR
jgi:5-oxoprolinase (ATP-hydrolysing) subunit A